MTYLATQRADGRVFLDHFIISFLDHFIMGLFHFFIAFIQVRPLYCVFSTYGFDSAQVLDPCWMYSPYILDATRSIF